MKIAFLHFWTLRLRRGVETLTISLANALAQQGHEVTIIAASQTVQPLVMPEYGVRINTKPTFRFFESITIIPWYIVDLITNKYDVVVVYFSDFGEGAALNIASIFVHFHQILYLTFPYNSAPHRYKSYLRWKWEIKSRIILADAMHTAIDGKRLLQRDVLLLPSGTDPQRFVPNSRRRQDYRIRLGFTGDEIVLLNVSALERRKGVWRVIEVLPQLLRDNPRIRYLILGDGVERLSLEARVTELGLEEIVTFGGTTSNLPAYYNAADIFVMLSDEEAGSIALLEAMASGLPVVVSEFGGFKEVVEASCGVLVDSNSPTIIITALNDLIKSHTRRLELGCNAREYICRKYSWTILSKIFLEQISSITFPRKTDTAIM